MTIDILFPTWNRLAFTDTALRCLLENTDWELVDRLVVWDDSSEDGTRELLEIAMHDWPCSTMLVSDRCGNPVEVMRRYLRGPGAKVDAFAKIDSDVAVPAGWLPTMLDVFEREHVSLLGMEAGMTFVAGRDGHLWDGVYRLEPSTHIGGVGLMRREIFDRARFTLNANGQRNGFTEWQHQNKPRRGWITPDLPVVLLDRMPIEPWLSLSHEYEAAGWQRPWPKWDPVWMRWAYEWLLEREGVIA